MYQLELYNSVIGNSPNLLECRKAIDEIDCVLYDLFIKRINISNKVSIIKNIESGSKSFFRVLREVEVIKNAHNGLKKYYPKAFCVHIWRLFISALLNNEREFTIVSSGSMCYWLSREYFGSFIQNTIVNDDALVVDLLFSKKYDVGCLEFPNKSLQCCSTLYKSKKNICEHGEIIPYCGSSLNLDKTHSKRIEISKNQTSKWWLKLIESDFKVFAIYPFIREDNNSPVLLISDVNCEETGDESSLIVIKTELDSDTIMLHMTDINFSAQFVDESDSYKLFMIKGFISDNCVANISIKLNKAEVYIIGAFANPF